MCGTKFVEEILFYFFIAYAIIYTMEPSYNSGGQGVPGVSPGMIASGPNIGSGQPVSNVSFSDTEQGKSKKNFWIVGVVVVIILAVLAVIVGIIVVNNNSQEKVVQRNEPISLMSFNRLVNYVTFGEESEASVATVDSDTMGDYLLGLSGNQKQQAYVKTCNLTKRFKNDYDFNFGSLLDDNAYNRYKQLATIINYTNEMCEFMSVMNFDENEISGYEIVEMAETYGVDEAMKTALGNYDFSSISDNSYVATFTEAYVNWVNALLFEGDVRTTYLYLEPYYNMVDDYMENLSSINNLLEGFNEMGRGIDE